MILEKLFKEFDVDTSLFTSKEAELFDNSLKNTCQTQRLLNSGGGVRKVQLFYF